MLNIVDETTINNWTIEDVSVWLTKLKFDHYIESFNKHGINGRALLMLDEDDLKQLIKNIGDRKNLYFQIKMLKNEFVSATMLTASASSTSASSTQFMFNRQLSINGASLTDSIHKISGHICENCLNRINTNNINDLINIETNIKSENLKTFLSFVYLFISSLWTAFILTIVHDRVPDMQRFPPLPDLILDNVPLMQGAFYWTETIGLILVILVLIILYCHKFRSIVFRRICSLGGTIFFLRSITMLITSLSVPGIHLQCSAQTYGSLKSQLIGAWRIFTGIGLTVHGVRTCGDYMFSGHTVWLTLCTHFICEYTPYTMNWLHTGVWVMNIFGLFFILAAHEHYSIDVFIGFYITSRLFLYYHSLSNNKVLFQRDQRRVKIWFPLFSYFEANVPTQVPNEYESPKFNIFSKLRSLKIFNKTKNANGNKKHK